MPSLELNSFHLTGSWGPNKLTNPDLNHQVEVVISSWNFKGMGESIKVSEQHYMEFKKDNAEVHTVAVLTLVLSCTLETMAATTMRAIGREDQ